MQVCYDSENDILKIVLSDAPVRKHDSEKPGVVLGYGGDGTLVDFEIRDASRRIDDPRSVDLSVNGRNIQGMMIL